MKSIVLVFFVAFYGGCLAIEPQADDPTARSSNAHTTAPIGIENGGTILGAAGTDTSNTFSLKGCWLGERGGAIFINASRIEHFTKNRSYSFEYEAAVPAVPNNGADRLIHVRNVPKREFLQPFVRFKYQGPDEVLKVDRVLVRGYRTYEDAEDDRFVTSEYFYRDECRKLE